MTGAWRMRPLGDRAALVEVESNECARALAARIGALHGDELIDIVPGHRTVLVRWTTSGPPVLDLELLLEGARSQPPPAGPTVTLDVVYDGADLEEVADHAGLSVAELVARHAAPTYRVGFVGFAPGFAYLLGGDPHVRPPRRASPRKRVSAGAIAVAGPYTACYPAPSPGGWRLLGRTDARLFDPLRDPAALLRVGMGVRLRAV